MARKKNPIDKLKDAAFDAIKDPVGTAGKAVEQAKETAAIGKMVAGQVGRAAATKAVQTVGSVAERAGVAKGGAQKRGASSPATLRPVPPVADTAPKPVPADASLKSQGDPVIPAQSRAADAPGEPAAKKAPAQKMPAKKTPAKKAAKKAPAKKTAKKTAKKAATKVTPADVAKKAAKKAPAAKKTAKKAAKKAPAKKATSPGDRLPPRKPTTAESAVAKTEAPRAADQEFDPDKG